MGWGVFLLLVTKIKQTRFLSPLLDPDKWMLKVTIEVMEHQTLFLKNGGGENPAEVRGQIIEDRRRTAEALWK